MPVWTVSGQRVGQALRRAVVKEDEHQSGLRKQILSHELEDGLHLFARDVELLDDLIDAEIVEILEAPRADVCP